MMLANLAVVVRGAGLDVEEVPDWGTRSAGSLLDVTAIICHHTGGAPAGDYPSLGVVRDGRKDLPGPLAQLGLARSGKVYVIAAGRANHAGMGSGYGMPKDGANAHSIGIEAESVGDGSDWTEAQRANYPRLCAALATAYGVRTNRVIAHREWAPGRKPDPVGIDMDQLRRDVDAIRAGGSPAPIPTPGAGDAVEGYPPYREQLLVDKKNGRLTIKRFQTFLADRGYYTGRIDGDFGPMTWTAVRAWMYNAEENSAAVATMQLHLNNNCNGGLRVDGDWTNWDRPDAKGETTGALQRALNGEGVL